MSPSKVMELYMKERMYEQGIFGDYADNPKFNIATFMVFIEKYLNEAKEKYAGAWTAKYPEWLKYAKEGEDGATAPVETYAALIKLFAMVGAALEAYTEIDISKWRSEGKNPKWKEGETYGGNRE